MQESFLSEVSLLHLRVHVARQVSFDSSKAGLIGSTTGVSVVGASEGVVVSVMDESSYVDGDEEFA